VYDTLSTSDIKTIVNATNSSTELNWRYLWFNATVPINSSIVIDIELPLALCTNLTIYKYYNNTFQPNKATKINSTSCSFSINITDDDFKGDLTYGARRRKENGFIEPQNKDIGIGIFCGCTMVTGKKYVMWDDDNRVGRVHEALPDPDELWNGLKAAYGKNVLQVDDKGNVGYWDIRDQMDKNTMYRLETLYPQTVSSANYDGDGTYGVHGIYRNRTLLMVYKVNARNSGLTTRSNVEGDCISNHAKISFESHPGMIGVFTSVYDPQIEKFSGSGIKFITTEEEFVKLKYFVIYNNATRLHYYDTSEFNDKLGSTAYITPYVSACRH